MTLLTANRITKSHGPEICFRNLSFTISGDDRIGLIGPNGSGKTTFFKVLSGEEDAEGEVSRRRGLCIARLDQTPSFTSNATPRSIMAEAVSRWDKLDRDIDLLREELADMEGGELDHALQRLADLEACREAGDGESATRRALAMLRGVGLGEGRFDQDVESMSGGERCRVALARLLLEEPDLWLLDEPTNHLDLAGIVFLERFLRASAAAVVVVSHDRRFLDQATNATWELEDGELYRYPGAYSRSRLIREERRLVQWREFMKQREFMRREERFIDKWRAGTRSRQAQSRMKRLAKVEMTEEPRNQSRLAALDLKLSRRLGALVLETRGLAVGFPGTALFSGLDLELSPGETVGIVGPNGSGKTSLFSTLLGALPPLSGTYRWGPTVEIGVLGQHESFPDEKRTPLEYLRDSNLGEDDQDRRDKLGAMLFSGADAYKPIAVLSGGEKKRLMLTRLLLEGHNVLLLDEPTNHLDIQSAEAATLAFSAYPGTVAVISHDRYFLDEIADRILWLEDGTWRITRGGFVEAEAERDALSRNGGDGDAAGRDRLKPHAARPERKEENPFADWRTGKIEARIIENEERMGELHAAFLDPTALKDGNRMRRLQTELSRIESEQAFLEKEYSKRG
ncbi:MAG: ATP-binding cassette domain-containing protein [Planctomycetota bacterium]|jgi:ATP-binding cassette subfamily F protein 3|nr:ATP-binding cassette domain-containing protein [Planctomycetota bacterium]